LKDEFIFQEGKKCSLTVDLTNTW